MQWKNLAPMGKGVNLESLRARDRSLKALHSKSVQFKTAGNSHVTEQIVLRDGYSVNGPSHCRSVSQRIKCLVSPPTFPHPWRLL